MNDLLERPTPSDEPETDRVRRFDRASRSRIATLARHEYRAAVRSRVLLALIAILGLATVASVYIASVDYASQLADYNAYKDAAIAGGVQQVAPSPLALLALLRGAMEYLEIIGAVIAITLGYLSITRERGNRTLPLIRSRPVTAGELATGNALGAVGLIATLVTITAAVAVLCLGFIGHDWPNGTQILKLLLAYGAAVVYMTVFYFLGAVATARAKTPANGLMIALGVWLIVVLVLPQIGDTLDADNQVPGGLFASLGLVRADETTILAHFAGYETARTAIEAASFSKHFERFAFAMTDVKAKYVDFSLSQLLDVKRIELEWLAFYAVALTEGFRRAIRRQPTIPQETTS
ncbi:MAG: ABC transporter permease subunit [Acidimicrobiales bacterium]|nr:ABC transporter permease subunit [Acidimicrobiales bacterium]